MITTITCNVIWGSIGILWANYATKKKLGDYNFFVGLVVICFLCFITQFTLLCFGII